MAKRPDKTSMEGMLWSAHHALEKALDPDTLGIPKSLFLDAKGIVITSVLEAGFIFSGNVATGIIMVRDEKTHKWSAPSAVGLGGVGFGFVFGAAYKDLFYFLMDASTAKSYSGEVQVALGANVNLTVGLGRESQAFATASNKGVGGVVSVAFSKGAFVAATVKGGTLRPRPAANKAFYGKDVTPTEILYENAVEIPQSSLIPEIHEMLEMLAQGSTWIMPEEKKEKVEAARKEAEKAGEKARKNNDDIVYVDAAKEVEKEKEEKEQENS